MASLAKDEETDFKPYQIKVKNLGGSPSKYNGDYIRELGQEYLETWMQTGAKVPSKQGFALFLASKQVCNPSTFYKWMNEDKPELSEITTAISMFQHEGLITNGLSGRFNPTITKLMLSKHGYSENNDQSGGITINIGRQDFDIDDSGTTIDVQTPGQLAKRSDNDQD